MAPDPQAPHNSAPIAVHNPPRYRFILHLPFAKLASAAHVEVATGRPGALPVEDASVVHLKEEATQHVDDEPCGAFLTISCRYRQNPTSLAPVRRAQGFFS
jgi:hypothetical protein